MSSTSSMEQSTGIPFDSTDYAMNCVNTETTFVQPTTSGMDDWEEVDDEDGEMKVEVDTDPKEDKGLGDEDDELFQ